jgi:hypothetical protein
MNIRKSLKKQVGVRTTFTATVDRFGLKAAYRGLPITTVCLTNVRATTGTITCDHLWLTVGKQLQALCLLPGQTITFDARVTAYQKGYRGYRDDVFDRPVHTDYRLSNPTRVSVL